MNFYFRFRVQNSRKVRPGYLEHSNKKIRLLFIFSFNFITFSTFKKNIYFITLKNSKLQIEIEVKRIENLSLILS